MFEISIYSYIIGIILDVTLGDPRRMPHVVKVVGIITKPIEIGLGRLMRRTIFTGFVMWLVIVLFVMGIYCGIAYVIHSYELGSWAKIALDSIVIFQAIAFKDLLKHLKEVRDAFKLNVGLARRSVSQIVSRDTQYMDRSDVCRATIESGSENLNDAIVGPIFWLVLLGPMGALFYRICNTLDAIVGHRNERYEKMGKFSARMDDILNYVPARICTVMILGFENLNACWKLRLDARKHPSINAGWPEAAMAKYLGVILGGRMFVNNQLVQTAQMNIGAKQPEPHDIDRCIQRIKETFARTIVISVIIIIGYKGLIHFIHLQ
ncbi:adenosylcobinamide-phosphate synthase CbiB [Puniceicoccaceae bacterium K14]|nr:adenosylcobinamide-phosphate synthase CbiB [Puniceicoccaceae bacterium K14]